MPKRKGTLTQRQIDFIYDIVWCNMDPFDSYSRHYSTEGLARAHIRARVKDLMSKDEIQKKYQEFLNEKQDQTICDEHFVIDGIKKTIREATTDSAKIRGYELLGKHLQMFKEHIVYEDSKHQTIAEEVRKNRERIRNGEEPKDLSVIDFESEKKNGTDED